MNTDGYFLLAGLVVLANVLFGLGGLLRYIARKEAEKVLRRFVLVGAARRTGEQAR
jgi:hypothetical protein